MQNCVGEAMNLTLSCFGWKICFQLLNLDLNDIADCIPDLALFVAQNLDLFHLLAYEVNLSFEVILCAVAILLNVVAGADIDDDIVDVLDLTGNVHGACQRDEACLIVPVLLKLLESLFASAVLSLRHFQRCERILEDRQLLKQNEILIFIRNTLARADGLKKSNFILT